MEINKLHNNNKEEGYEGSMIRSNAPYEHKRSWTLQKVKDWTDEEFKITRVVEGVGKFAGGIGKLIGVCKKGIERQAPWPNLTIRQRQEMWTRRKDLIGKLATVEYFELTRDGAWRFPRIKTLRNYE